MSGTEQQHNPSKEQEKSSDVAEANTEPKGQGTRLPRRFGRLLLLRQLARGGMGEVFLAASGAIEGAERPTVVKIIRRDHKHDESFLARFLDEARIQAQLQHPGVAQILEATQDEDGDPHVVVEYVEGRNLAEVRSRASQLGMRITWPEALAVAISMADALAHVHERTDASGRPLQIVHRDLSPQNVMVSYSGDTKLIDFGTARGQNRKCHTVSGIVFAKPGYVAPEVANNTPGGVPADLYAFGIMFWELLAGRRFLSGEASAHLAQVAVGKRNPTPLAQLTGAPETLDQIIAKLTAPRIEDRYESAREALADLLASLKKAPSMADGDRSVRGRIAHLMQRLYPAEPARSRAEFARLVACARDIEVKPSTLPSPSPEPASVDDEPSDLLEGTRFRLIREIGRGGMGTVYEACHVDLGRTVALKVLKKEHSTDARRMKQFRAEARLVAGLEHENLVKVHEFGVAQDGRAYYTMDLLEGRSLAQYLEQYKGMDWREAVGITIQACHALEVAHAAGVTHCDIKPANLFLTQDNVVKLLDFGIAKSVSSGAERPEKGQSEAIRIVGTPEYLAPEQAQGREPDERTDVYSLGSVLYELVTGRLPHHANNTIELLDLKSTTLPESPRQRAPQRGLPPMLDKAIMNSLKTDPGDRFQSAEQLREALEAALREPERMRQRRRRMGFATLGAIAVVCGIGAGVVSVKPELRARVAARVGGIAEQIRELRNPPSTASLAQAANEAANAKHQAVAKPVASPEAPVTDTAAASNLAIDDGETQLELAEVDMTGDDAEALEVAEAESESAADEDGAGSENADGSAEKADAPDELMSVLVQAEQQMTDGNRIKGFNKIKRLARKHPKDARVQRVLSESAVQMKAWGLAHRAAARWVELEPTVDARIQLAKMERATSRGNYRSTLKKVLAEQPDHAEAMELLGGKPKQVASRE